MYKCSITALIAVLMLVCSVFIPFLAQSEYYLDSEPDFELAEITEMEALSIVSPHPLMLAAQEVSGVELLGMFELEPDMARYFEMRTEPEGGVEYLAEFEIVPNFELVEPEGGAVSYIYPEGRVMVGFGVASEDEDSWQAMTVFTYWVHPNESVEELARYQAGAEYCPGIYALDLTRDGVTELIISWATGVAGGGGVDIVSVVPTGGLEMFGDDPEFASIWSTWGSFTLMDYNRDGAWDIEVFFPVLCNPCGYYGSDLLVFNRDKWDWVAANAQVPEYYIEQAEFYARLVDEVSKMIKDPTLYITDDPDVYGNYGVEIDGEMNSLLPFISEEGEIGELEQIWIDALNDYSNDLQEIVRHAFPREALANNT